MNAAINIRINTDLSRLGTSVSSPFFVFLVLQGGKVNYAKLMLELANNLGRSSKDQQFFARFGRVVLGFEKVCL